MFKKTDLEVGDIIWLEKMQDSKNDTIQHEGRPAVVLSAAYNSERVLVLLGARTNSCDTTAGQLLLELQLPSDPDSSSKVVFSPHKHRWIHAKNIAGLIGRIDGSELERMLRGAVNSMVALYYETFHRPQNSTYSRRIHYAGRVFNQEELQYLVDAALDFWLTSGRFVDRFEKGLSDFLRVRYCSATNSGSSANLLAFMALTSPKLGERRIKRGDEVITVAAAFPTTVAPIVQYGAVPVFVDITIPQYNIDPVLIEQAITPKTKAVMVAHTLGNPFQIDAILDICERYGLWLIEDNCDALGSQYYYKGKWHFTGTFGHLATSSFYPPHHITTGEGGAVYTDDLQLKRLVDSFRDWGRDCWCPSGRDNTCGRRFQQQFGDLPMGYDHKYVYSHLGYNLKMTEMQAAVGCAQLKKLSHFIEARRRNWRYLHDALHDLQDWLILPEPAPASRPSWFGFLITIRKNAPFRRDDMVRHLEAEGIQTRMLFAGNLLLHPCFDTMKKSGKGFRVAGQLLNTDTVMKRSFWIGVSPAISAAQLEFMAQRIKAFVKEHV